MKLTPNRELLKRILPYLVLYLLVQIFFYKVVFLDHNFFWRDLLSHSYPAKKIFVDAIKMGEFPLWNPYVALGLPYLADLSNQPLYPFNLIFLFLPANTAMNMTILLHYVLCAFFSFLFIHNITKNKCLGLFGAIAFTFCGYNLSISSNLEYLSAIAWLPAIFWAFYRAINTSKTIYIFLTALFLSLLIYGGEPMAYYFITGFLLLRCLFEIKNFEIFKKFIFVTVLSIILSAIFSAAQLLPSLELISHSVRSTGLDFREATIWSMNPLRLIEFYLPFYYGYNFPHPVYWGVFLQHGIYDVPWAESVYIGTIPVIMIFCSFYYSQTREKYFWLTLIVISTVLAFGSFTPVYKLLYDILPMFGSFRYPEKLVLFISFAAMVLATLSLKEISENKPQFSNKTEGFIIALVLTSGILFIINLAGTLPLDSMKLSGDVTEEFINNTIRFRIVYFVSLLAILTALWWWFSEKQNSSTKFILAISVITFLDLFFVNTKAYITSPINFYEREIEVASYINTDWNKPYPPRLFSSPLLTKYLPFDKEEIPKKEFLKHFHEFFNIYWLENLIPNRSILYDINLIYTVSSLSFKDVIKLFGSLYLKDKNKFFRDLNINYILAAPADVYLFQKYARPLQIMKYKTLLKLENIPPRAFIVTIAYFYDSDKAILSNILSPGYKIDEMALFKKPELKFNKPTATEHNAKIINYSYNNVNIETSSNGECYLILLDSFYPGWKAFIDEQEVEVLKANLIYRSIKLPAGNHHIRFTFAPPNFKKGIALSLISLLLALISCLKFKTFNLSTKN